MENCDILKQIHILTHTSKEQCFFQIQLSMRVLSNNTTHVGIFYALLSMEDTFILLNLIFLLNQIVPC